MSDEPKRYTAGALYEEPRPGGIPVYLASDYDALKEELEYARAGILSTEAVAKYKATIQDDLKRQIEDLKRENERLRLEHIPKPCNCGAYRWLVFHGEMIEGWQCPVHGVKT